LRDYETKISQTMSYYDRNINKDGNLRERARIRALYAHKRMTDGQIKYSSDIELKLREVAISGIKCPRCVNFEIDELHMSEELAMYQAMLCASPEQISNVPSQGGGGGGDNKRGGGGAQWDSNPPRDYMANSPSPRDYMANSPSPRNARVLSRDVTVRVTYPESQGNTVLLKLNRGFSCSNIMDALVSNVKQYEQGCKAFVKCSNGFHNELLLDQPYYNTMHEYYLRTTSVAQDFPLSDPELRDFFPSTPLERGKNQVNSLLADLYKTIHQLEDDDELVFFSSQTPTLQPAMTIDAVKGSVRFNEPMIRALDDVTDDFNGYRTIRGDGNCYFRAFMVGFIEDLIRQRNFRALFSVSEKMREVMESKELRRIKPQRYYLEKEFLDYLGEFITKLENTIDYFTGKPDVNDMNLWKTDKDFELDVMQTRALDIVLVWSSRLMVSEYLVKNKDRNVNNFGMSIDQMFTTCFEEKGIKSTEDYCESDILTWGVDAESPFIELGVLEETLGCNCNIIILDRNGNCKSVQYNLPEGRPDYASVALFLKPGHYDLLCPIEKSLPKPLSEETLREIRTIYEIAKPSGLLGGLFGGRKPILDKNDLMMIRRFICMTERDENITYAHYTNQIPLIRR